ncbi:MAG: hypothetical protein ABFE13_20450 [Phycisphaerales bacterium]
MVMLGVLAMIDLDRYRLRVQYQGLTGFSEIGFMKHGTLPADLFPTADELILSMKAYFLKLDESASILYEVPDARFGVVEDNQLLEVAVPDHRGEYTGLIIDVLALDSHNARMMMDDIETTCALVKSKFGDAMGVMGISEGDYVRRLQDSMKLMAHELRR